MRCFSLYFEFNNVGLNLKVCNALTFCFDLGVCWRHPQAIPTISKDLRVITFCFPSHFFFWCAVHYSLTVLRAVNC